MSRMRQDRGDNGSPTRVQVARTLVMPQPELSSFLDKASRAIVRRLGGQALIGTLGGLHLTLLESGWVAPAFRQKGYTPRDVRLLSGKLDQYLANIEGTRESMTVEVDEKRPFVWFGWRGNKLALNVRPSKTLRQERALIEEFLTQHLGSLPPFRNFDEHVVIASVHPRAIDPDTRRNPRSLLPSDIAIPYDIAVNGLMVFLNGIGDSASTVEQP